MQPSDIVIVSAKRTPMGRFQGELATLSAPNLGALAHRAVIEETHLNSADIDEVITGCVLQAGVGQGPARQAAIQAGIPSHVGATTLNKLCGSGMKAIMLACDMLHAGTAKIILASGMESMSQAPYLLKKARTGYRLGHGELIDHIFKDGLEDAYHPNQLMGHFADKTAQALHISREAQDEFARMSMTRALAAQASGAFQSEIVPIFFGEHIVSQDENPQVDKLEKIGRLKPAFSQDGSVTAGNASSISDGAASLLLTTYGEAVKRQMTPLARIVAHASHAGPPEDFTLAPIQAIQRIKEKTGWREADIDLYEINEAFAVVVLAAINALSLPESCVNIHGGACALGHPIGASGARIVVTLLHALKQQQKVRGIASLCIGGGEATALAIELV